MPITQYSNAAMQHSLQKAPGVQHAEQRISQRSSFVSSEVYVPDSSVHKLLSPKAKYDGVYFVDRERRITYWNKAAEELTGYSSTEAVGRQCFDNFLVHVNDQGCPLCLSGCPLVGTISDGKRREAKIYLQHKLGHRVPVSVRVAPVVDSAGHIAGAGTVFCNVQGKERDG
jgi:PAS domain S-box-containing protein